MNPLQHFERLSGAMRAFPEKDLEALAQMVRETKERGGTLFLAGNGGGAACAAHWTVDMSVSLDLSTRCLGANLPTLTALSNDIGYQSAFAVEFSQNVRPRDALICMSCSGSSQNIRSVIEVARIRKVPHLLLTSTLCPTEMYSPETPIIRVISHDYGVIEDVFAAINHAILAILGAGDS